MLDSYNKYGDDGWSAFISSVWSGSNLFFMRLLKLWMVFMVLCCALNWSDSAWDLRLSRYSFCRFACFCSLDWFSSSWSCSRRPLCRFRCGNLAFVSLVFLRNSRDLWKLSIIASIKAYFSPKLSYSSSCYNSHALFSESFSILLKKFSIFRSE